MKFIVELEDFWLDEEEEIAPALKAYILSEVVRKVSKSIEEKTAKEIIDRVNKLMEERMGPVIDSTITELMETETIVINGKPVLIKDRLKGLFQANTGWSNPADQIRHFAKQFGDEMKLQYNAAFANQIVAQMKVQGFLKDEVTELLLGGKKNK